MSRVSLAKQSGEIVEKQWILRKNPRLEVARRQTWINQNARVLCVYGYYKPCSIYTFRSRRFDDN